LAAPFAALAAVAALGLILACGGDSSSRREPSTAAAAATESTAGKDAEQLGEEALKVMDDVMAYGTSRRRLPESLREAGIDSLTATTARWYAMEDGRAVVWVAYRQPAGHALVACSVDRQSLEDRGLAQGGYRARCRDAGGAVSDRLIGALE
jgi:hypothetical protein